MNNFSTSVQSLFNLTLNKLSYSMNEDLLKSILKCYPTSIAFKILRKIFHIQDGNNEFVYCHTVDYMQSSAYKNGIKLILMMFIDHSHYPMVTSIEVLDKLTECQQVIFLDKFNFCNYFDLELFFKYVEYTYHRNDLFVLFQICVQKKGLDFPKQFAKMWIESKTEDEINLHHIERGLKLGIFLGDSGWFSESAFVLSYTYKIISTNWVYSDQNLKLTQSIQCLTKWLLVVTIYHDFDEAKVVLSHILKNIELLEQTGERHLHIINAYIAVSEYYFVIVNYNESWLWANKAVSELHDEISDYLKLLVMSHCIKICFSTNKLMMAKLIVEKLSTDKNKVNPNFCIEVFRNIGYHLFKDDLSNFQNYFVALNSSRNLFGYFNLHTANIFVDYAFARYIVTYPITDLVHVMSSITQGIYIMEKIGMSDDNMMLVNARMLKSFMLQKLTFFNIAHPHTLGLVIPVTNLLRKNLRDSESYHVRAIELSRKTFGEESLFTARLLYYLGKFYQEQQRILSYRLMRFNVLLSGTQNSEPYYKESEIHINYLYEILKNLNLKSEQIYLKSIKIYETICGPDYFWLLNVYQRLLEVYNVVNDSVKHDACLQKLNSFKERVLKKEEFSSSICKIHENYSNNCTSLELLKSMIIKDIDLDG